MRPVDGAGVVLSLGDGAGSIGGAGAGSGAGDGETLPLRGMGERQEQEDGVVATLLTPPRLYLYGLDWCGLTVLCGRTSVEVGETDLGVLAAQMATAAGCVEFSLEVVS